MTTTKKKKLIVLDAHAILHRAYHALPDFTSAKGEPTGALYGLSALLLKIANELSPDYIVACFDLPEPTYRHDAYEDYKAGRAETDSELSVQIDRARDVFEAFGIPIYEAKRFEADDIIGTIAEQTKKHKDLSVIIASGDMDTLQLVEGRRVTVFTLRKGLTDTVLYDEAAVKSRFGFPPVLLPDFKGLSGDSSDNIVGIKGIGPKTATTLITKLGTVEEIYDALKDPESVQKKTAVTPRILKLLTDGEEEARFSKMLATIRRDAPITLTLPNETWQEVVDVKKILALFHELSFRTLALRATNVFGGENAVEEVVENREDVKDDILYETALKLWLLRSDITNPGLEDILQFTKKNTFADATKEIEFLLKKEKELYRVYTDIERPLIPVLERMHTIGVLLDKVYLKKLSKEYHKELSAVEKRIFEHVGMEFNVNSPKQLGEILFEKLGLSAKNQKRTSTGQRSTRESELEKLRGEHPIIADILGYRELQKLLSTYIDNLPDMASSDGRLHTTFLQTGTTTGRMASQNPNLQNIPIKSEAGRKIRNGFIAAPGYSLVAIDYSQIELRVAAFLSGDKKLLSIFAKDGDIHSAVAADVFNVPPELVNKEMRRKAKVINFGILYGMGVNALRAALGAETSRKEAQDFYNNYFQTYTGLASYLDWVKAEAHRKGFTETHFGRRRYFEGIRSSVPYIRASAERMAINAPIQGTQADIIKIAMRQIYDYIDRNKLDEDVRMLLQVHDELVFEVKKGKEKAYATEIATIMEGVLPKEEAGGITFRADMSAGPNWGELKKM